MCPCLPDVNCTCKAGYVGDGFSCSGNLLQVLMSVPSLTNFLTVCTLYLVGLVWPQGRSACLKAVIPEASP